jgi:hypothetical protein
VRRHEFEHVIAAAADAVGLHEFVVIGSQAILGSVPDPPEGLLVSMEVDLYPKADPDRAEEVDGAIGDGSMFAVAHGYYAHGVGPETATPPAGWEARLVRVDISPRIRGVFPVAWCLERHDVILAKVARGSERDWQYARTAVHAGLVDAGVLLQRVEDLPIGRDHRGEIARGLQSLTG